MIKRLLKHDFIIPDIVAVLINLTAASPFFIAIYLAERR